MAAEQRRPLRWVTWYQPTPSWRGPLKSELAARSLLARGRDEGLAGRRLVPRVSDGQRAARAVVGRRPARVVLSPPEIRHEVRVGPARAAVLVLPGLEIVAVAADVDHRVDAAGSAQDLAARPVDGPAGRAMLRDGGVVPVIRALQQAADRGGSLDLVRVIGRPGFQQQDADAGIGGQPRRQDAARAAGADDDVVIHGGLFLGDKGNNNVPWSDMGPLGGSRDAGARAGVRVRRAPGVRRTLTSAMLTRREDAPAASDTQR